MNLTVRRSEADVDEEFHFVIKSPPNSSFIRQMHKFFGKNNQQISEFKFVSHKLPLIGSMLRNRNFDKDRYLDTWEL